ncbi:hypothetical protein B0T16DRAFT_416646 [Cercophora newfieldiana]|uniref:Cupredoxin n=1 Tax=Cercophora newfieldiana TaxID=92897 RepID=A0AA40CNS0_9PEZI|nr:hypothetical protein B0T16DRAFT_416646 [Cercophora newfieldiana]
MMFTQLVFAASLAWKASAANIIPISVGRFNLTFTPNTINVTQGDIIEFRFWARNHSVVQGTWDEACKPINTGGFFSGFVPQSDTTKPNNNTFRVTVNNTDPIIVYCSQNANTHCKNGMVAVINPRGANNFTTYFNAARQVPGNSTSPPSVFGGVFASLGSPAGTSSSSTSSSTATSTATTTSTSTTTSASATATNVAGSMGASLVGLAAAGAAAVIFI